MDALVVIDMQEGLRRGEPKHDLVGVLARIDRLAGRVRARGGCVFFVQHDGPPGDDFALRSPGWTLIDSIERDAKDRIVHKTLNDAFFGTTLRSDLEAVGAERVLIAGWATDLCVDATVRSAAACGFEVVVVADGHTVSDRPHLGARQVIEHHHWIWANLIAEHAVRIVPAAQI
ncbi:isochorismatase family protein [Myxococcota bacterium]|nr:isochorismatase family protein [Myxococcota bacterium]